MPRTLRCSYTEEDGHRVDVGTVTLTDRGRLVYSAPALRRSMASRVAQVGPRLAFDQQARRHVPPELRDRPGTVVWEEIDHGDEPVSWWTRAAALARRVWVGDGS